MRQWMSAIKNNFAIRPDPIKGEPLPVFGVVAFLDHNWNKQFSTQPATPSINICNYQRKLAADFHQGHYALTNLLYYPTKNVMMGGEFQFGRRVNFS